MNYHQLFVEIEGDRSKANINNLIQQTESSEFDIVSFFEFFHLYEASKPWLFTWWLSHFVEAKSEQLNHHALSENIYLEISNCSNESILRDLWRALTFIEIKAREGELFDLGLKHLMNEKIAIAPRAHAMLVVSEIAFNYPDLLPELKLVLTSFIDHESAGLRSRSKNILKRIKRLKA